MHYYERNAVVHAHPRSDHYIQTAGPRGPVLQDGE
jgi:hypothetical protein